MRLFNSRTLIITLSILLVASSLNLQSDNSPQQTRRTINVTIAGFAFSPSTITVDTNEAIRFDVDNQDSASHTFTVDGVEGFDLVLSGNSIGSFDWDSPATAQVIIINDLGFYCTFHPFMTGTIVVQSSQTTTTTTTTSSQTPSTTNAPSTDTIPTDPISFTSNTEGSSTSDTGDITTDSPTSTPPSNQETETGTDTGGVFIGGLIVPFALVSLTIVWKLRRIQDL